MENKKIKFHIPDFVYHRNLNLSLIDYLKEKPEYFYDNIEIASVYGCFPPGIWNGGRNVFGKYTEKMVENVIEEFNSRGIPIRYTFTNPCITEEHLQDEFCNMLCRVAENGLNEIIVNKPVLEDYIRKHYSKFPLISSTVKQIESYDKLCDELEKDYKLVVLDYNWNNDWDMLDKIPHKEKCEILINPYCSGHCKRRGAHYKALGERQINYAKPKEQQVQMEQFYCENATFHFYQTIYYPTHVKPEDIYSKYVSEGFTNFKIEGRMIYGLNVLESYVYYMIKPEYKDIARLELGIRAFNTVSVRRK